MQPLPALHPSDADFAAIRRDGDFYVDKTPLFRDLLAPKPGLGVRPLMHRHQFLARPRRFGKTLLINTLEAWFQGLPPSHRANPEDDTGKLEGLPAGWTSPPWLWDGLEAGDWHGVHGWHPVIRLDLSQLGSPNPAGTRAALRDYMEDRVGQWTARGTPWPSVWPASLLASGPERILRNLIQRLDAAYGRQPVVLVDEYDAPIVKHIGTDRDLRPAVEDLQDFFRVLKDDEGLLYGVFVTGITRFARHHLFSAANNFRDISDLPTYGALCGFTEDEVDRCFAPYRQALAAGEPTLHDRDIQATWRRRYNGYRFSTRFEAPRVYNPFTLTAGLTDVLAEPALCREAAAGIWPSAWSRSGHPGLIARLAADTRRPLPTGGNREEETDDGLLSLKRPRYPILMQETGYYTWHGGRDRAAYRDFPNEEVAESWTRDILGLEDDMPTLDKTLIPELKARLADGDVDGFGRRLERFVFHIAHQNLNREESCRALLQALFLLMAVPTQSEKSNWGGRSDHEIQVGDRVYVFEVKYNETAGAALRQIRARGYGREHLDTDRPVTAVGLAFRRDLKTGPCLQVAHAELDKLSGGPETEEEGEEDRLLD